MHWNSKDSGYFCFIKFKSEKVYENAFLSIIITEEKLGLHLYYPPGNKN